MRKWRSKSGVTLLELLFVVILIGILAAVFLPKLLVTTKSAAANAAAANLATCASAVQSALSKGETAAALDGSAGSKVLGDYTVPGRDRLWKYSYATATNAITATKLADPDINTTIIYDIDDGTFTSLLAAYNVTGG